ncbi:MAG: VWA domain-containing protein [Bacilli bacterium]|nr:VWA domain-containing protein [Bacilli bacterium]
MKKNCTELVIILDKSGSMNSLAGDVIGGYNALIADQRKQAGDVFVTTILFDTRYKTVHSRENIKSVGDMDAKTYIPGGCTALLDALGTAIANLKETYAKLPEEEIPEHVIFSIMTDGLENSSREYTYDVIKKLVSDQKKAGWDFLFQAANIDAFAEGHRLGISPEDTASFMASKGGVHLCFCSMNERIHSKRREK